MKIIIIKKKKIQAEPNRPSVALDYAEGASNGTPILFPLDSGEGGLYKFPLSPSAHLRELFGSLTILGLRSPDSRPPPLVLFWSVRFSGKATTRCCRLISSCAIQACCFVRSSFLVLEGLLFCWSDLKIFAAFMCSYVAWVLAGDGYCAIMWNQEFHLMVIIVVKREVDLILVIRWRVFMRKSCQGWRRSAFEVHREMNNHSTRCHDLHGSAAASSHVGGGRWRWFTTARKEVNVLE